MLVLTGFVTGIVGSLHCVGMCGPIALALPGKGKGWAKILPGRLLYNVGRITTYALLGLLIGAFGRGLAMAGWQQGLSIALGIFLLVLAIFQLNPESGLVKIKVIDRALVRLRSALGTFLKDGRPHSMFQLGLLNGLLPCGFVYVALAGALSTGTMWEASAFMAMFGAGTLPAMLAISIAGGLITPRMGRKFRPFLTGFTALFGVLLILRGMNLGIPYISPEIVAATEAVCH